MLFLVSENNIKILHESILSIDKRESMEIAMNHQHLIQELQDYMLSEKTLQRCLLKTVFKQTVNLNVNLKGKEKKTNQMIQIHPLKEKTINIPKQKDTLFWCFYIMVHGEVAYEMLQPINLIVEKKWKIDYIEKIRQHKNILKQHKFATLVQIENQLLNEQRIDLKTFFYLHKKTYYELRMNDAIENGFILHHYDENGGKYGFKPVSLKEADLEKHRTSLFKIERFDKPLKALSAYKIQELVDFNQQLGLQTLNQETNKPKKKQELYESLIQYF